MGGERREGQHQLAGAVADAISGGHHLLAEAPTGSGKSLAYLVPAVASGLKVIVATSTIALQSQLAGKDLPALQEHGTLKFSFALLKGRSNYLCRAKLRRGRRARRAVRAAGRPRLRAPARSAARVRRTVGDRRPLRARGRCEWSRVGGGELCERRMPGEGRLRRRRRVLRGTGARPGPGGVDPRREPRAVLRPSRFGRTASYPSTMS